MQPESFMKAKLCYLFIMLALLTGINQAAAQIPVFPIATNASTVQVPGGFATSGSNSLAAILSGTNICFQLVSTNGTLIGPLTTIGSGTSFPLVAYGGGNYLIYWDDNFINSGGVFGQIISRSGVTIGSPFSIGAPGGSSGGLGAPRALTSDGTNFLAVLEYNDNYYGQLITPAGAFFSSPFLIASQSASGNSATANFGKTNFLVAWQINNSGTSDDNTTYGEFVSSSGFAGSPFQINQTASLDHNPLAIGFDGTNYLVIWNVDTNQTVSGAPIWSLYGRLVSQTGTFSGNEFILNTNQALFPSLAFDGANYLFGWSYNLDTSNANKTVFFQFLNRSASPIGPVFNIFQSQQGTNAPLIGNVLFTGSKFVVGAGLGVLQVAGDGSIGGFLSGQTYGAFIQSSAASPTLTASNLVGTQFPLQLTGTPGINYALQISTNLALSNWTAVVTNSPTNGIFSFTDTHATNASRFYRAMKQ